VRKSATWSPSFRFLYETLQAFLYCPILATWPTRLILLVLVTQLISSKEYWSHVRLIIKHSRIWSSSSHWFIFVKHGTCDSLLKFALSCNFLCIICPVCLPDLVWAFWFFHPHILWPYILGGFWNPLKTEI
jgi:hypothetical protein